MLVMASLRWRCVVSVAWAYGYGHAGVHGTEEDRAAWTRSQLTAEGDGAAPLGSVARAEGERHLPPALVGELAKHSALHEQRDRAVDFDGTRLLVYVLSMDDAEGQRRWGRLKRKYGQHFGVAPDEWDRLWFRPVTRDAFVDQEDSQGRYTLKPAFKSSFVPGVERVLMIPEVSQYLSFVAFLFDFVQTGAERAVFLEDDFNFIPIVDNQVYNGSLVPWSEIASDVDEAAKAYEYSPAEFRNRVSMSLQRWASSGEDVLYLGSLFETTKTSLDDLREAQLLRVPSCAMGLHGIVVSRTAARKLLTGMVPIWTRSDAAIHLVPQLRRREAVPGIVGQNKYWEVYKARSYSSLNDVAAWQSRYKAIILRSCAEMGVCTADLVSVEWYAAVWGRTIASIAALVVFFVWIHDRLTRWLQSLLPTPPKLAAKTPPKPGIA